jgi:hypothetical protein
MYKILLSFGWVSIALNETPDGILPEISVHVGLAAFTLLDL